MRPADCKPGFDYLEHEARFQAAAVWWLETLLVSSREPVRRGQPRATRIAAALLAASSFLFLLDEGRLENSPAIDIFARKCPFDERSQSAAIP